MATTERTRPVGLKDFLPAIPNTPPLVPRVEATTNDKKTKTASTRRKRRALRTPLPKALTAMETQESRRAKTVRIGQYRSVNLLRAIRLWGNLAARSYDWKEGEVERMYGTFIDALKQESAKFDHKSRRAKLEETFQLATEE